MAREMQVSLAWIESRCSRFERVKISFARPRLASVAGLAKRLCRKRLRPSFPNTGLAHTAASITGRRFLVRTKNQNTC
jgi:hypothetical protein